MRVVSVSEASEILRRGGLVAIPTETVYGLAAHALDAEAVAKIFAAKGRPATNPLIVHVGTVEQARALSSSWSAKADALAAKFWPGPLTIVVPRAPHIPDIVTAGGPTVAIRIPAHPIARALATQLPLAAPSANPSNTISPTLAQHVIDALGDRVEAIVDGGPTTAGIESTVVSIDPPRLLRPGIITPSQLEEVLGPLARSGHSDKVLPSPGMMDRHYAPRAKLEIVDRPVPEEGTVIVAFDPPADVLMPRDAREYAARLYAVLHDLDRRPGVKRITVQTPPPDEEWLGVRDRLSRASR